MLDRITGMQVFARVASLGGFSQAARVLGLSQTMVTKHVAALEARLDVKLFSRTTRSVTLTEAGRRYLVEVERILADIEEAERQAVADHAEARGLLRAAIPVVFGTREVAPLLGDFCREYPEVTVELGLNDRIVDLVEEGWDMAVRVGALRDSSLTARRLAPCSVILAAAPDYLARRGVPARVEDLATHDCLAYTLPDPAGAEIWRFGEDGVKTVRIRARIRANSGEALRMAALGGLGIVCEPRFIIGEDLRAGRLVEIVLDHKPAARIAVHAVLPPGRNPAAKVRAFVDFLARRWATPPWERT